MLDYLSTFVNTNGLAFPNTAAINASGGAATDGTEFTANMINDSMWGILQAIMNHVGQTPTGVVEGVGNSQILDALQKFEIPGKIVSMVLNDDPAVLGIRVLALTGQGILRANYAELDANVYVGDGNNASAPAFYHADDAAGTIRNTAGAYLILPDARGRVVRGLDLTGSVDPGGASRALGDLQGSAMWSHFHDFYYGTGGAGGTVKVGGTTVTNESGPGSATGIRGSITDGVNPAPTTDSESRMKNISANLMITY